MTPMTLEDALRFKGYAIEPIEYPGATITTPSGSIVVPPLILSALSWKRTEAPDLASAFYLDRLTPFDPAYKPVLLSHILDRYRTRRLGYDMPDEFGLAVRRWGNLHLGPLSILNRRYLSAATDLPLNEIDLTREGLVEGSSSSTSMTDDETSSTDTVTSSDSSSSESKGRNANSEFPDAMLAGNLNYASSATDSVVDGSVTGSGTTSGNRSSDGHRQESADSEDSRSELHTERGRSGRSVMELLAQQREAFLNVDEELLEGMSSLFLSVFDRSENYRNVPSAGGYSGYDPFGW